MKNEFIQIPQLEQPRKKEEYSEKKKRRKKLAAVFASALSLNSAVPHPNEFHELAVAAAEAESQHDRKKEEEIFREMVVRARKELEENGIPSDQQEVYKGGISEAIYSAVEPRGYEGGIDLAKSGSMNWPQEKIEESWAHLKSGIRPTLKLIEEKPEWWVEKYQKPDKQREDAWKLYLGLPQMFGTFGISDYHPEKHSEQKYYFKINNFWSDLNKKYIGEEELMIESIVTIFIGDNRDKIVMTKRDGDLGIMGDYTLSKGHDERGFYISYYDKWDFDKIPLGSSELIGKPLEIYDRLYYDPKTFKSIEVQW